MKGKVKLKDCFVSCRLLLVIAIVSCCGAGYFIRRRVHTYTLPDRPDFNVTFTRHPILSPGDPTSHIIPHSVHVQHSMVTCLMMLSVYPWWLCGDRTATGRLSELRGCRDHSHFNSLPHADSPRSSDNCIPSPTTLLQPTPSFLWSSYKGLTEEINSKIPQNSGVMKREYKCVIKSVYKHLNWDCLRLIALT